MTIAINGWKILNAPNYATEYKYIVATPINGELWFYGAYNDADTVQNIIANYPNKLMIVND